MAAVTVVGICGLLHGEVTRLGAVEDLVYVDSDPPLQIVRVRTIGHEAAGFHPGAKREHRGQSVLGRKRCQPGPLAEEDAAPAHGDKECVDPFSSRDDHPRSTRTAGPSCCGRRHLPAQRTAQRPAQPVRWSGLLDSRSRASLAAEDLKNLFEAHASALKDLAE